MDIVLDKTSKPFSSIYQSRNNGEKIFCSLCANAGIESVIKDDICQYCGDIGVKHGISNDDELFVVNAGGGGSVDSGEQTGNGLYFNSFGGFDSLDKKRPQQQKSLQDALKETEI